MIDQTFRKPLPSEDVRWVTIDEIKEILGSRYASFDIETGNTAMGNALNNSKFSFKSRSMGACKEYRLVKK